MYLLTPKMDKSLPFEKVQPQWQLLYLFLRVYGCNAQLTILQLQKKQQKTKHLRELGGIISRKCLLS